MRQFKLRNMDSSPMGQEFTEEEVTSFIESSPAA